jgi:hypothetical protein
VQFVSTTIIGCLTLVWGVVAVLSGNHTKLASTLCGQNKKLLSLEVNGTFSYPGI